MTDRLSHVYAAIDAANAADPVRIEADGAMHPGNLLYGQRMSAQLDAFAPDAAEALRIAARGQHIERWILPRASYPEGKSGYFRWRRDLKIHHAQRLAEIMQPLGYAQADITRVGAIVRKDNLASDPDVQILEDVACLVFLVHELDAFRKKHGDDNKLADILAKTWKKMSPRGHEAALALPPPADIVALLEQGLARLG
jgi:hypothetical protein